MCVEWQEVQVDMRVCLKRSSFLEDMTAEEGALYHVNLYRPGKMGEPFSDMKIQGRLSG